MRAKIGSLEVFGRATSNHNKSELMKTNRALSCCNQRTHNFNELIDLIFIKNLMASSSSSSSPAISILLEVVLKDDIWPYSCRRQGSRKEGNPFEECSKNTI